MTEAEIMQIVEDAFKRQDIPTYKFEMLAGIGSRTVYYWFKQKASPRLYTLIRALDALGLELQVVAK